MGYETVNETTGEGITETILLYLKKFNISIQDRRGQGYDIGSNMKGMLKGVQATVLKMNSRAFFVPCACHSLNLVVADAASSSLKTISLFGVLQRIYVIFSASLHRWKMLTNHVKDLTINQFVIQDGKLELTV